MIHRIVVKTGSDFIYCMVYKDIPTDTPWIKPRCFLINL